MINANPFAEWTVVTAMSSGCVYAVVWIAKLVLRHRKSAAKMLAVGLDLKSDERDNPAEGIALSAAVLQFLQRQEERDIRQGERMDKMIDLANQHAMQAEAINQTLQHFASLMQQTHDYQNEQIAEVKSNQINLSNWLRERMGGGQAWPSGHQRPPRQASA